jgi:hypothetical protein
MAISGSEQYASHRMNTSGYTVRDDEAERMQKLEELAELMDSQFAIPGIPFKFGLDSLVGLIPGIGDTATTVIALYIFREAVHLGIPTGMKWRMGTNIFIDWFVGSIPVIGDIFDFGFKCNRRNMRLLRRHMERKAARA